MFVSGCQDVNTKELSKDPSQSNLIDEQGYKILTSIRHQGLTNVIGVLSGLTDIKTKKQNDVKKLFQRYFESEFTKKDKCFTVNTKEDIGAVVRALGVTFPKEMNFHKDRSYMLVKKID